MYVRGNYYSASEELFSEELRYNRTMRSLRETVSVQLSAYGVTEYIIPIK